VDKTREPQADFDKAIAHERAISKSLGGRRVMDGARKKKRQLGLFD